MENFKQNDAGYRIKFYSMEDSDQNEAGFKRKC